jgi:hypothetical protein
LCRLARSDAVWQRSGFALPGPPAPPPVPTSAPPSDPGTTPDTALGEAEADADADAGGGDAVPGAPAGGVAGRLPHAARPVTRTAPVSRAYMCLRMNLSP